MVTTVAFAAVHTPAPTASPPSVVTRPYVLPARFVFKIHGGEVPNVASIEGLAQFVLEYSSGSDWIPELPKFPGRHKWPPITLKRGKTSDNMLFNWRQKAVESKINMAVTDCTLETRTPMGKGVEFVFEQCWPSKYEGAQLDARTGTRAREEVEISYESVRMAPVVRSELNGPQTR